MLPRAARILFLSLALATVVPGVALAGLEVTPIPLVPGKVAQVTGNIDRGQVIPLEWATNSAVACFPTNHFDSFRGKHVLYRFDLPAKSIATITLKAKDGTKDLNLYTYRAAVGEKLVPPEIYGTQCEASYGSALVGTKPNPGEAERLEMCYWFMHGILFDRNGDRRVDAQATCIPVDRMGSEDGPVGGRENRVRVTHGQVRHEYTP